MREARRKRHDPLERERLGSCRAEVHDFPQHFSVWPDRAAAPLPAVIVIQKAWGVDGHIEDLAVRFAAIGAGVSRCEGWIGRLLQHAFFNDTRPTYNAKASRDAFARTLEFFRREL